MQVVVGDAAHMVKQFVRLAKPRGGSQALARKHPQGQAHANEPWLRPQNGHSLAMHLARWRAHICCQPCTSTTANSAATAAVALAAAAAIYTIIVGHFTNLFPCVFSFEFSLAEGDFSRCAGQATWS